MAKRTRSSQRRTPPAQPESNATAGRSAAERLSLATDELVEAVRALVGDADEAVAIAQGDLARSRAIAEAAGDGPSPDSADAVRELHASAVAARDRVHAALSGSLRARVRVGEALGTVIPRLEGVKVGVSQPARAIDGLLESLTAPPVQTAAPNAAGELPPAPMDAPSPAPTPEPLDAPADGPAGAPGDPGVASLAG